MSAITQLGANKINADVAGNTTSEPAEPTAAGPQWSEMLSGIGSEYGGLSHLFGETITPVETAVAIPTDSVRGRLGGLVPSGFGVLSPGPTAIPQPVNDGDNDPGVTQPSVPGQVAQDVAAVPGGFASVPASLSNGWAKVKGLFTSG